LRLSVIIIITAWYAETCRLQLFFVCMVVDFSYSWTKFGTLIERAFLYIISTTGELWPKESLWGAKIHKCVKNCNPFLVHRLVERDDISHDDKHCSVAGLKPFWLTLV